jgi:hypothetical protein
LIITREDSKIFKATIIIIMEIMEIMEEQEEIITNMRIQLKTLWPVEIKILSQNTVQ